MSCIIYNKNTKQCKKKEKNSIKKGTKMEEIVKNFEQKKKRYNVTYKTTLFVFTTLVLQ